MKDNSASTPEELNARLDRLCAELQELRSTLEIAAGALVTYVGHAAVERRNPETWAAFTVTLQTPGRAQQFPQYEVPRREKICLVALNTNAGDLYMTPRQADSVNPNFRYVLAPGQNLILRLANTAAIYMDGISAGDQVTVAVEQEAKRGRGQRSPAKDTLG